MKKSPHAQINKASWNLVEGIKDTLSRNLVTLSQSKTLNLNSEELARLLTCVASSVDEGFHRGSREFDKEVQSALNG